MIVHGHRVSRGADPSNPCTCDVLQVADLCGIDSIGMVDRDLSMLRGQQVQWCPGIPGWCLNAIVIVVMLWQLMPIVLSTDCLMVLR